MPRDLLEDSEKQYESSFSMSVVPRLVATLAAASVVAIAARAPSSAATAAPPARGLGAAPATVVSASSGGGRTAALEAAMQATVEAGATGVSAMIDDGDEVTRLAVGSAQLDPLIALRPTDQARVGSITKTAIAVIALQLVGEGTLTLGDTIESWLPGMVPNGGSITIRMLLNHTSGIFNYTDDSDFFASVLADPYRHWRPREVIAVAVSHPPLFPPGTSWSYSNTGYILLGLVLQKATDESISDLVRQRVVRPLDLDNTYFANSARFRGSYAHGYAPPSVTGDGYQDLSRWSPSWAWAAGSLVSNPPDLARFYQALLSGRLLSPALLRTMTTTVSPGPGFAYGFGIFALDTPCGRVWGHDGGIPGYVSFAMNTIEGTRSAVVLMPTQPDSAIASAVEEVLVTAACAMFRQPVPAVAPAAPRTAAMPGFARHPVPASLRLSD